jgi:predicted nucleotidyltransferase component of viral defense system
MRGIEYPVFLGGDTIELLAYPVETSIAEKLQAMVSLGEANSRMKDFYDVWICASHLDFEIGKLLKAVEATFKNRETDIPTDDFEVLTIGFAERHLVQWNAFVKKMGEGSLANRFSEVIEDLRRFAIPIFSYTVLGEKIGEQWVAGKGWPAD